MIPIDGGEYWTVLPDSESEDSSARKPWLGRFAQVALSKVQEKPPYGRLNTVSVLFPEGLDTDFNASVFIDERRYDRLFETRKEACDADVRIKLAEIAEVSQAIARDATALNNFITEAKGAKP